MSRVIAVVAGGFALAACSMSMPSLDFFRSSPATEVLRIESEPPGADARTAEGQSCRTPCELTVPTGGELAVTFALNGYQPMTVPVRVEAPSGGGFGDTPAAARLQPNPVYAELQPVGPQRGKKKPATAKKKTAPAAKKAASSPTQAASPDPAANYPWPAPPR